MNKEILSKKIDSIDGNDYGAYQALTGSYDFEDFTLIFEQIPKDPYAPPHTGIYRIQVKRNDPQIINYETEDKIDDVAFRDFLARQFYLASEKICKGRRGTGYSGVITINQPGQAILERSCVVINDQIIEVRCFIGLPAAGRKVKSEIAQQMIFSELPQIIESTLFSININRSLLQKHINISRDAQYLRSQLESMNLLAFIINGAMLPRESGSSEKPLNKNSTIKFKSPESLEVEINLPHAGTVNGMGIPAGVTLITGGGYHGKSTLLKTIESGIYNHIPGDGRELCVSLLEAVKIRAYSGRYIVKTDISPFISNLPFDLDTTAFSTQNASGSTSQAAGIIEAIEAGAKVLLMDEDTCATNFMIRDQKMQQLVHKDEEPITTYIDQVRRLYSDKNISTILVLGGSGDYFDVADQVIQMNKYYPRDVSDKAREISQNSPVKREAEASLESFDIKIRVPIQESIDPLNEYGKKGIFATETRRLSFGKNKIDLTDLEQLVELSQTKAIGFAIEYAKKYMQEGLPLKDVVQKVITDIEENGLDIIYERISANFAHFRSFELAFTLNRMRGFQVRQVELKK